MRKANKIMMMTVSILLCLVLITSTVMSSTLAKYVTTGSASSNTARVAKWGVTVKAWINEPYRTQLKDSTVYTSSSANGTASVTIGANNATSPLRLKPGDDFSDIIRFEITGKAEVKLEARMTFNVSYGGGVASDYGKFLIPAGVGNLETDTYFVPIGHTFGALYHNSTTGVYSDVIDNYYIAAPWRYFEGSSSSVSGSVIGMNKSEKYATEAIAAKLGVEAVRPDSGAAYISKEFAPGEDILFYAKNDTKKQNPINTFEVGYAFPIEWPPSAEDGVDLAEKYPTFESENFGYTVDQLDQIGTYLTNVLGEEGYRIQVQCNIQIIQVN